MPSCREWCEPWTWPPSLPPAPCQHPVWGYEGGRPLHHLPSFACTAQPRHSVCLSVCPIAGQCAACAHLQAAQAPRSRPAVPGRLGAVEAAPRLCPGLARAPSTVPAVMCHPQECQNHLQAVPIHTKPSLRKEQDLPGGKGRSLTLLCPTCSKMGISSIPLVPPQTVRALLVLFTVVDRMWHDLQQPKPTVYLSEIQEDATSHFSHESSSPSAPPPRIHSSSTHPNTGTTRLLLERTEVAWCHTWHPPKPRGSQPKSTTHHSQEDHLAVLEQGGRRPYLRSL